MSGEYKCNECGFRVPADEVGVELMKAHLAKCESALAGDPEEET